MPPVQRVPLTGIIWLIWLIFCSACFVVLLLPLDNAAERRNSAEEVAVLEQPPSEKPDGDLEKTGGYCRVGKSGKNSLQRPLRLLASQRPGLLYAPDINAAAITVNDRGQVVVAEKQPEEAAMVAAQSDPPTLAPDPAPVEQEIEAKKRELWDEEAFQAMLGRYEVEMKRQDFCRRAEQLPKNWLSELIKKYSRLHMVDSKLVWAVMRHESGFNPRAVSPKGAMGLMQLIPSTAALMGVSDPFDVEQNINGGVRYLKICLTKFNDNVIWALAAYNAGPDNVVKYQGCPPFAETRTYVLRVMRDYTGHSTYLPLPLLAAARLGEQPETTEAAPEQSGLDWNVPKAKFKIGGPKWLTPPRPTIILARIPAAVRQNPEVVRLLAKHNAQPKYLP